MKKKPRIKSAGAAPATKITPQPRRFPLLRAILLTMVCTGVVLGLVQWRRGHPAGRPSVYVPRTHGQLTFNKDIAPVVFQNCALCHRPGQSGPFSLLSYQDVKTHAHDIVEATARHFMPPWMPEPGYGEFAGERRLSVDQIGLLQQWVAEGAVEGAPGDLPPPPRWNGDWQLGQPDLVVTMPETYTLAAEGRDVYRNFVLPVPVPASRFVRGVEFHPGNARIVHHAVVKLDRTAQSRRLDADADGPGFGGMEVPAEVPGGHFFGWQPGRLPTFVQDGLAWRIDPGNDLVLQMHLNPDGRPEALQSSVGLYFTDQRPTNTCLKLVLTSFLLDIPAGESNFVVEQSFVLPAAVQALAVLPHAHYLARDMRGWATLPDGTKQWLIWIKDWDFNWQGDYRFAHPLSLPRGTILALRYTYDNSTNNLHNPNHPPRAVHYGSQSRDEMAELWLQLLPGNEKDRDLIARAYMDYKDQRFMEADELALRHNPDDFETLAGLGLSLIGKNRLEEAGRLLRRAVVVKPGYAPAHYNLGLLCRRLSRLDEARAEFETTLQLDPKNFRAHGNLGAMFLSQGDLSAAQTHFTEALRLNPDDDMARDGLKDVARALGRAP